MRRWFLIVRRVTVAIIGIAAALVATEYGMRFNYDLTAASSLKNGAARTVAPPIPDNSLGFREREVGPKDPARYRIAIIGDSYTYGEGLEERERFSNLIEASLGPGYEVLNFGVPGNKMPDCLTTLDLVLKLKPDFVLLQMSVGDFETSTMQRPSAFHLLPGNLDHWGHDTSMLYRVLNDRLAELQEAAGLMDSYVGYMSRHLRNRRSRDALESFGNLRRFFDHVHAEGVPTGAILFPAADAMGPFGSKYAFGYLHDHVSEICAVARIPFLDLRTLFSAFPNPESTWVSPNDAHPNAATSREVSAEILHEFGSTWRERRSNQNWK